MFQVVAFIVGFCYFNIEESTQRGIQAVQGILFMFVTENTFSPMYATLAEFPENKPIFIREYSAGLYSPSTYYLTKIFSLVSMGLTHLLFHYISETFWYLLINRTTRN